MAVENDIVLVYHEGNPLTFARIESIEPDIKRGWYHVKLLCCFKSPFRSSPGS